MSKLFPKLMRSNKVLILDGGLATELEKDGFNLTKDPLWSARLLDSNANAIVKVHKRFLENGADIITTASYQASISGFQKHLGIDYHQSIHLIQQSVELAKQARQEYIDENPSKEPREIAIAGSVGPYGACLADGSEYTGNYCDHMSQEELIEWHRPRVKCLIEAGVDILAFETIPALKEAKALMILLTEYPDTQAWLSFSCKSPLETVHREEIGPATSECLRIPPRHQVVAVGVNCCPPEFVESLLKSLEANNKGCPFIVYPNSGENWTSDGWTGNKNTSIHTYLQQWIENSAKIIGGCCRTGPTDTAHIFRFLQSKGHNSCNI